MPQRSGAAIDMDVVDEEFDILGRTEQPSDSSDEESDGHQNGELGHPMMRTGADHKIDTVKGAEEQGADDTADDTGGGHRGQVPEAGTDPAYPDVQGSFSRDSGL